MKTIDELLQSPYWIIDILPAQVPKDSPGQYFAVEDYFLQDRQLEEIKQKHINLVLKLNCYIDISINEELSINPSPEHIAQEMRKRYLYIIVRLARKLHPMRHKSLDSRDFISSA